MNAWRRCLAAGVLLLALQPAWAGRNCEARAPDAWAVQRGLELAERTEALLRASGARVVVLARAGQDLSKYRLRWSHLGFAYREGDAADAPWRVLHKLNDCGSAVADLHRQGLGEFFLDDPYEFAGAVAVLAPDLQAQLLPLLRDNRQAARLHTAAYSLVAYPWAERYQQSNQWAIETLAMAADPAADTRGRAQAWLRLKGYEPTELRLSPLVRLGARIGSANVAFDDHPDAKRFSDRIETVTADSVLQWLTRSALAQTPVVVR